MLGGIAIGTTTIEGFLASEDCLATLKALKALGVKIDQLSPTSVGMIVEFQRAGGVPCR